MQVLQGQGLQMDSFMPGTDQWPVLAGVTCCRLDPNSEWFLPTRDLKCWGATWFLLSALAGAGAAVSSVSMGAAVERPVRPLTSATPSLAICRGHRKACRAAGTERYTTQCSSTCNDTMMEEQEGSLMGP